MGTMPAETAMPIREPRSEPPKKCACLTVERSHRTKLGRQCAGEHQALLRVTESAIDIDLATMIRMASQHSTVLYPILLCFWHDVLKYSHAQLTTIHSSSVGVKTRSFS